MSKQIVCLSKTSETGKSASIIALAELLIITRGYSSVKWVFPSSPPSSITQERDVCVAINVTGTDKWVGLSSHGDVDVIVMKNLNTLLGFGCEIIFCAIHTSRSITYKIVENIARKNGCELIWTGPYFAEPAPRLPPPACLWPINQMKALHLEQFI
jgi:hypothetical protein